jgi:hypothetical protein
LSRNSPFKLKFRSYTSKPTRYQTQDRSWRGGSSRSIRLPKSKNCNLQKKRETLERFLKKLIKKIKVSQRFCCETYQSQVSSSNLQKKNRKETLKNVSNNKKTKIKHGKFRCETYHYHFPMIPDLETYKKRKVKETLGRFLIKKKQKR